jgi:uncharacterized protein
MGATRPLALLALVLLFVPLAPAVNEKTVEVRERSVSLYIAAVGQREDGSLFGVLSVLTLTAQAPGRGDVFVRTEPLAEVDMQGAARLAVAAAGELTGTDTSQWDYLFTVTTGSAIIGGPSAGGAMAAAASAVLMNWSLDPNVAMTGMINPDLSIGLVGGVLQKAEAVAEAGVKTFLIPAGERIQYTTTSETQPDGTVVQRQQAIDVADYARRQWGLEVIEVEDLYDVMPHFTGLALDRPSGVTDPTREQRYQDLMAETSSTQVDAASAQLDGLRSSYESHTSRMGATDKGLVETAIDEASTGLGRARDAADAQRYYQSSSFAFQSLVQSRFGQAIVDFYDQQRGVADYVAVYLDGVGAEIDKARNDLRKPYPLTSSELGAEAASEIRLDEAAQLVDEARTSLGSGEAGAALRTGAFARERVGSARWWGVLRDRLVDFGPPANVTEDGLRALGDAYLSSATLMVSYAERVLGSDDARLAEATTTLQRADASLHDDEIAAGTYGALHSISLVNAAMAGFNPPDAMKQRLATLRNRTAFDIETARAAGVEPVYAVSLYEFALYQESTDVVEAYEGYSHARMAARATLVAGGYEAPPPTWHPLNGHAFLTPGQRALQGAAWAWMALLGIPSAVGLALGALVATRSATAAKR